MTTMLNAKTEGQSKRGEKIPAHLLRTEKVYEKTSSIFSEFPGLLDMSGVKCPILNLRASRLPVSFRDDTGDCRMVIITCPDSKASQNHQQHKRPS